MNRRRFLAAAAGTTAALPLAHALAKRPKEKLKLVSSLPRTGSAKGQTDTIANAIRLAIGDYDDEIGGFGIEYLDWDDATAAQGYWDPEMESKNARKAVRDDDVMAYIGPYNSGAAKISMPIMNEAGLVQVSPVCTWPGLTKKVDDGDPGAPDIYRPAKRITFCRVCPHDGSQGPLAADFARDELKAKSVYILDDKELYGQSVAAAFQKQCEARKIKILGRESINTRQTEFVALLKKIKGLDPDLLYFGGTAQSRGGEIARDMTAAGLKCPLLVPDGCYELVFIEIAGADNLKNCYVSMGGLDLATHNERGIAFAKAYKARFKTEPQAYALYGYEAAKVILEAVKAVGKKDRDAIRKAVLATKDFEKGVLEKWSFDANGDTTLQQLTISKVEKGKFVPIKVLSQ
jgi:branched-chain amino acid transport system substrate-binding protein